MSSASKVVKKLPPGLYGTIKQWAYNTSGFCQLGLKHNDVLRETPDVEEALRRLPKKLVDERNFRLIRAFQLSTNKMILPREQWTKYEEDDHYLEPYIEEVIRERKEKEEWNKKY
ncbi:cytochrome b-c1 complex subunit 7-like [Macrosteles quadrilineatus]|uniref:cytochrome b-c1 complex subunit 7-like n=1 Tax=Macrosteles quadrilineatus TaxID=74068 RepID=UPI0023E17689|nr:cytochrome b-c1 complex subunit 7-like [Macrosteles quadrilineatus]